MAKSIWITEEEQKKIYAIQLELTRKILRSSKNEDREKLNFLCTDIKNIDLELSEILAMFYAIDFQDNLLHQEEYEMFMNSYKSYRKLILNVIDFLNLSSNSIAKIYEDLMSLKNFMHFRLHYEVRYSTAIYNYEIPNAICDEIRSFSSLRDILEYSFQFELDYIEYQKLVFKWLSFKKQNDEGKPHFQDYNDYMYAKLQEILYLRTR